MLLSQQQELPASDIEDALNQLLPTFDDRPPSSRPAVTAVKHMGTFAFVELAERDDAERAFALDGVVAELRGGRTLTLRVKPAKETTEWYRANPPRTDFTRCGGMPTTSSVANLGGNAGGSNNSNNNNANAPMGPGGITTHVPNGPNKLYLGNIPHDLSEADVQRVLESIGALSGFKVVTSPDGQRRFAFFCYQDESLTPRALTVLHGFEVGGRRVTCSVAGQPPAPLPPPANAAPMGGYNAPFGGVGGGMPGMMPGPGMPGMMMPTPGGGFPFPGAPDAAAAAAGGGSGAMPGATGPGGLAPLGPPTSRILSLRNMVTVEELEAEYDDIMAETREEAEKWGRVETIKARGDVIYIAFTSVEGAAETAKWMHGRQFAQKIVRVDYVPEAMWLADMF